MSRNEIDISYENGKIILNHGAKMFMLKLINKWAFDKRDIPLLTRAVMTGEWNTFAKNCWGMCFDRWRSSESLFEVRDEIDWLQAFTLSLSS